MQVALPCICCAFVDTAPDGAQSFVVLDVRGCHPRIPTQPPMLQLTVQQGASVSGRTPLAASLRVESVSGYFLQASPVPSASARATCFLTMQAPPSCSGSGKHDCALFMHAALSSGLRRAARAVLGDAVASAWDQAEAHWHRDWIPRASGAHVHTCGSSAADVPVQGKLLATQFDLEQAHSIARAGSLLQLSVRAPCVRAHMDMDDIPWFSHICEGSARLLRSSDPGDRAPVTAAPHIVVSVAAAGTAALHAQEGLYELSLASAELVHGQGLAGQAGASLSWGRALGVHLCLTPPPSHGQAQAAALLYHIPEIPEEVLLLADVFPLSWWSCCIFAAWQHPS
jgi:hypothetical protein